MANVFYTHTVIIHIRIDVGEGDFPILPWIKGSRLCPCQQRIFTQDFTQLRASCAQYIIVLSSLYESWMKVCGSEEAIKRCTTIALNVSHHG